MIKFEKLATIVEFMKPSNKAKHKTMVLIGSHGEVISIRRFLGLAIATTVISIITVVMIIFLLYTSSGLRKENREITEAFTELQLKIKDLKHENDILMARLVSEAEGGPGKTQPQKLPSGTPPDDSSYYDSVNQIDIEEEIKNAGQQSGGKLSVKESIEVENLIATHESNTKTLQVRFDLRNADPNLNPVSGRTVVILKTGDQNQNNWLTLPFVPLISGKPASTTTGRTFLISRFKTVKFSIAGQTNLNRFTTATVFVFSKEGNTLVEKDFKVEVKEVMASAAPPDSE